MALAIGALSEGFAFEQGSTWGTAVAVGAGDGMDLRSFSSGGGGVQLDPRDTLGNPNGDTFDNGVELWSPTADFDLFYGGGCGRFLSYIFGTSGAPTDNTGSYTHTLDWTNSLTKFATIVNSYRSGQKWHEFASAKMSSLTIQGSGQGRVTGSATWIASARDRDSSTNTTTQTDAVTVPTKRVAVYHHQGVFRINAQTGGALSGSDNVSVGGFTIEMRRPLAQDVNTGGNARVDDPCEDGLNEVYLTVRLPSYNAETYLALVEGVVGSPTEQKATLTFSSGYTPASGLEMTQTWNFPRLVLAQVPDATISGPQRIPHEVRFRCLTASSAPTGMTGITEPISLVIEDEVSSAYLA